MKPNPFAAVLSVLGLIIFLFLRNDTLNSENQELILKNRALAIENDTLIRTYWSRVIADRLIDAHTFAISNNTHEATEALDSCQNYVNRHFTGTERSLYLSRIQSLRNILK